MRHTIIAAILPIMAGCTATSAANDQWIEEGAYSPVANATKMDAAFLIGSPTQPCLYTIRVHLKDGGLMPPHTHPDDRIITVLYGTLHYGFGTTADPAATKAYPTGASFFAKANDPHYAIGMGNVVYQEVGMAPTETKWVGQ